MDVQEAAVAGSHLQAFAEKCAKARDGEPKRGADREGEQDLEEAENGDGPAGDFMNRDGAVGSGEELAGEGRLHEDAEDVEGENDA